MRKKVLVPTLVAIGLSMFGFLALKEIFGAIEASELDLSDEDDPTFDF